MSAKKRAAPRRPPPPRWTRRPEARPREILTAALRQFAERGYVGTSLEDVAAAAGVTKGTIYYYFRNKEALLLRLAEENDRLADAELEQVVRDHPGTCAAQLRALFMHGFADDRDETRRQLRIVFLSLHADAPRLFARVIQKSLVRGWELLQSLIERGQAAGEFRRDADAPVAARLFTSGLVLQYIWRHSMGLDKLDPFDARRMVDSTIELFLHSLRPAVRAPADRGRHAAIPS